MSTPEATVRLSAGPRSVPASPAAKKSRRRPLLAALLALLPLACAGEDAAPYDPTKLEGGLVVTNPTNAERPFFHDFGRVPFGEKATHVFELRNDDEEPLVVRSIQGGCACIKVSSFKTWSDGGEPIVGDVRSKEVVAVVPAGGRCEMAVRMDTSVLRDPNKEKLEILRLSTSSLVTPFPTFELRVQSQQLFQVTPRRVVAGDVPHGAGDNVTVRIVTAEFGGQARILDVARQGEHCRARLTEEVSSGELLWSVHIEIPALLPRGPLRDEIVLSTTDENGEGDAGRETIEVWAQVTDDVVAEPRMLSFTALRAGEAARAVGKLRCLVPGLRVKIESVEIEGDAAAHFACEPWPNFPDAAGRATSWEFELLAKSSLPAGRFSGHLVVELDDEQTPQVRIPYSGLVR